MTLTKPDFEKLAKQVLYDLSVTRTRVSDLLTAGMALIPDDERGRFVCDRCLGLSFSSQRRLDEHNEHVHEIPLPGSDRLIRRPF